MASLRPTLSAESDGTAARVSFSSSHSAHSTFTSLAATASSPTSTNTSTPASKPSGLSLGLASFLRSEHMAVPPRSLSPGPSNSAPPLSPSYNGTSNPFAFNCLTIQDHKRRSSCSPAQLAEALQHVTPPMSPDDNYADLYPPPPHLTPQPSPSTSPRSFSPFQDNDHPALPTTHLMGKLTIRVVEARNLSVSGNEKPYILLQYDRTDSVSREYGASTLLKKPKHLGSKRPGANAFVRGNGRAGNMNGRIPQSSSSTGSTSPVPLGTMTVRKPAGTSEKKKEDGSSAGGAKEGEGVAVEPEKDWGTTDAPKWDHVAQFDVVQPGRTILLCIYDKLAPIDAFPVNGFLGATIFEAPLSREVGEDGLGLDLWAPLSSAVDPAIGGEVRVRILFETLHTRPRLTVEDFDVHKLIGQGSFGQVFKVRKRDTKRTYAMKVIAKSAVTSKSALRQVLAERQVLARTGDSPFLVGLKFSFQSPTSLFLVIDYKSGGELFGHLQKDGGRFEEGRVRFYISEIILALEYLHTHDIVYRDLKPENLLLDGSGHCVLVDFGLSKLLKSSKDTTKTLCGTTAFMAPEVLMDIGYSFSCDWWSLGCLLFEMCYGWSPFYAESQVEEYERILSGEIKIPSKKGYSPENKDLLLKLLTREPQDRLGANGAAEIQSHPFFTAVDWRKVALRQISPPYKPPQVADDEDGYTCGRTGDWMFGSDDGSSRRASSCADAVEDDGLFRDFSFTSKPAMWYDGGPTSPRNRRSSWTALP